MKKILVLAMLVVWLAPIGAHAEEQKPNIVLVFMETSGEENSAPTVAEFYVVRLRPVSIHSPRKACAC